MGVNVWLPFRGEGRGLVDLVTGVKGARDPGMNQVNGLLRVSGYCFCDHVINKADCAFEG